MTGDLSSITKHFDAVYNIQDSALLLQNGCVEFTGLHGSSKALFTASLFNRIDKGIIVVTRNNRDAADFYTDLGHFTPSDQLFLFPSKETLPYDDSQPFREITMKRIIALWALLRGMRGIFLLPVKTFTDFFLPVNVFKESVFKIEKNDVLPPEQVKKKLLVLGYEREDRVITHGSFAMRGDILDIFAYGYEHPCRVEFFDDTVESIREFSPATQKSLQPIDGMTVVPAREIVVNSSAQKFLKMKMNTENREIVRNILEFGTFRGIQNYLSYLYESPGTVLDYAGDNYLFLIESLEGCRKMAEFFSRETVRLYEDKKKEIFVPPPEKITLDFNSMLETLKSYGVISILPESQKNPIDFKIMEKKGYRGQMKHFKDDINRLLKEDYTIIVGAGYEGQTNRLREVLKDISDTNNKLIVKTLNLHEGFRSPIIKLAVILDREIFNRKKRYSEHFLEVQSKPIEGLLDIKEGNHIVHVEHGIGIFRGIERLTSGGAEKDFVKIEYRDGDEIFIPVDQINLLQKYIGQEGRLPRIDKLGSGTWKKVKDHVKKSVKSMAKELLELYSVRSSLKGHAFSIDTDWQFEFESGFRYEETPDQIRTIEEIKKDMEDPKPMDRLICGDVGFGKTEVAIRVAFKAVMDGKQVAVLVPTTILAEQHLNTFNDRFSLYPINVEMLSRFKTPKQQREIIENLKNGLIDVVIGTHRLIQKDIEFKDLGLVIIDEEQRFGVEHKERLKQLRKLVDVITMTATPIPRTLYMSMTRIRDMSVMETPPAERIPIETYVLEYNEDVIVQAIRREVERGGQIYYVHNRVKTIDGKVDTLRRLMPGVTMYTAHGQMDEHELEEIMKAFFDMEFQVLVTTTIIESGLDIPNVNTIIIERADRFGLSQLYQLRGRVGRSKRKAYAYLLYPKGKYITEQAEKRLAVINDHTELGAGFSIALKDLEIRGAGNILGRQQHGEMLAVGFEMYIKLFDEAIRELKGTAGEVEIEPVLDLKYRGYIPLHYIESELLRVEIYKRFTGVKRNSELNDLREEMVDRFGALPPELVELFHIIRLRVLCRDVGIKYLREKENELQVTFERSKVDILSLIQKIESNRKIFSISPRDYNTLHIYQVFENNEDKYDFLKELFDYDEND